MAEQEVQTLKIFDIYDVSEVAVRDPALKPYLNIELVLDFYLFFAV